MDCAICGADNLPTARFCDRCGSALVAQPPATGATVSLSQGAQAVDRTAHHARVYDTLNAASGPAEPPIMSVRTPPGPPAPAPYTPTSYVSAPQQSSAALISMILGIVAMGLFVLLLCTVVLSPFTIALGIPAVFFGRRAQREIALSGGRLTGAGMARAGMTLGWINIVLSLIGFVMLCSVSFVALLGA
jgi:hypothetical protein